MLHIISLYMIAKNPAFVKRSDKISAHPAEKFGSAPSHGQRCVCRIFRIAVYCPSASSSTCKLRRMTSS